MIRNDIRYCFFIFFIYIEVIVLLVHTISAKIISNPRQNI